MSDYGKIIPSYSEKTRKTLLEERLGRLQPAYFDEVLSVEEALTYAQTGKGAARNGDIRNTNKKENTLKKEGIL